MLFLDSSYIISLIFDNDINHNKKICQVKLMRENNFSQGFFSRWPKLDLFIAL